MNEESVVDRGYRMMIDAEIERIAALVDYHISDFLPP
jgi:hypothetical protein